MVRERFAKQAPEKELASGLAELVAESEAAGFRFLRRLVDEWISGRNRFHGDGEALFTAIVDDRVIGVCGLNVDPYAGDATVGRVRHLYVMTAFRKQGIGGRLVERVIAAARGRFRCLRLRTDNEGAGRFYESLGFRACAAKDFTHALNIAE
jgi:GNAT superfamily N-acetyltransferase